MPPVSLDAASAQTVRDAVALHVAFALVALATLALPAPDLGWRLLGLVTLYSVALPLVGRWRGHREWAQLWGFLALVSVFQVGPDAFLASILGTLHFPDTGGPRLGSTPLAMAGMWTIPLWVSLFTARQLDRGDRRRGTWIAALVCGLVLVSSEATLWAVPIWEATGGVTRVGRVAVYVIAPEVLLGAVAYFAYMNTRDQSWTIKGAAAGLVSLVYLGALCASYGLMERVF
ncbi:MAG: hypothetical protein Rubg2KO_38810 [Rubricoccaceae bacterium]